MEKLNKKEKHDHKLTKWLKFGIFAVIMCAPFVAVLSKMIYVSCNKNAKDSYYGQTINEANNIYLENLYPSTNKTYYLNINDLSKGDYTGYIDIYNFDIYDRLNLSEEQYNDLITYKNSILRFIFADRGDYSSVRIMRYNEGNYIQVRDLYPNSEYDICIMSFNVSYVENINISKFIYSIEYNKYSYLDNSFYYAINEIKEEPIFNWAKNTGIYTTIEAMTSELEMDNTIALLLAYWSMCTAVYIVFDIIIVLFTKLTHFINEE